MSVTKCLHGGQCVSVFMKIFIYSYSYNPLPHYHDRIFNLIDVSFASAHIVVVCWGIDGVEWKDKNLAPGC